MPNFILLVDDNDDLTDNLKLILEMEGFEVRAVSCVDDALEVIEERIPALIVADVLMTGVNGFDLFERVKANDQMTHVPFVFMSALATPQDIERGMQLGADGYVTKPFAIGDLLEIIRRYIQ
jgi:DNA-binding response OmpR family regulator